MNNLLIHAGLAGGEDRQPPTPQGAVRRPTTYGTGGGLNGKPDGSGGVHGIHAAKYLNRSMAQVAYFYMHSNPTLNCMLVSAFESLVRAPNFSRCLGQNRRSSKHVWRNFRNADETHLCQPRVEVQADTPTSAPQSDWEHLPFWIRPASIQV